MHNLAIDISDSTRLTSFRVFDASSYDSNLPISEGVLEVYAPSVTEPFLWKVERDFQFTLNSNLLHLTSGDLAPLPDGTYYIKYSVKPNNKVYIQYAYFRNTKQIQDFNNLYISIYSRKRYILNRDFNKKMEEMIKIKHLIDAAKFMVEENHMLAEANAMYTEANLRIEKLGCYARSI